MSTEGPADPQVRRTTAQGRASGQGRVYQSTGDQLITEHHHHYSAVPPTLTTGHGLPAQPTVTWSVPDSVRTAQPDRPPPVLRNRNDLRAALSAALVGGGDVHVIHGMGGSGKTSLAHWAFEEALRQGHIGLWVNASDRMNLRSGMLAVAADRGADPGELIAAHHGQRAAADLVWHYLDRSPQRWLLVIDNADDPTILEEGGWLRSSTAGTVLVTSRRATASPWRGAVLHRLDVLPLEDAAQVLCDLAPDTGGPQEARRVARRLGCLPLALNLAGSYLAHQLLESWTMSDYHDRLEEDGTSLIDQGAELETGPKGSRHLVSRTWQITLDALAADGVPEATALLRLLSCWGSDPLPLTVLARSAVAAAGLEAVDPPLPTHRLEVALRALLDHSLAALHQPAHDRSGPAARSVQVHGVLLDSVHAGIPAEQRPVYVRAATQLLAGVLPEQYVPTQGTELLNLIAPHVTALLQRVEQSTVSPAVRLGVRTAQHVHEAGDYRAARALAALAGETSRRLQGAEHPDTLAARHQEGDTLRRLGQLEEAERLLREVYEVRSRVLGEDHPDTLQSAAVLSLPLYLLGRHTESLTWLRQAIAGQQQVLGEAHVESLRSRALILEFLVDAGHTEEFARVGPAVVTDCERHLGEHHPVTVIAYSNYAYGLLHAGTPEEAEGAARRALAGRIRLHGPEHPLVYSAKLVLSWALMLRSRHDEAVVMMREAVGGRERLLGLDHPLTVKARVLLAERLAAAGRQEEAEQLLRENLAAAESVYGRDDPDLRRARAIRTGM